MCTTRALKARVWVQVAHRPLYRVQHNQHTGEGYTHSVSRISDKWRDYALAKPSTTKGIAHVREAPRYSDAGGGPNMSSRKRQYIGRMATLALQSCETGSHGVSRRRALSTTPHSAGKEPHEPIQRLALYSSGEGYLGSLGHGDFEAQAQPRRLGGVVEHYASSTGLRQVAAGWAHSAVVTGCGKLLMFGRPHDMRKALSLRHTWRTLPLLVKAQHAIRGLFEPRNGFDDVWLEAREVPLPDGEKAQSVACSGALTAVLTESGRVLCMGMNHMGQCGVGQVSSTVWTPEPVVGLEKEEVVQVSCGFQHVVCRTSKGKAYAWGKGERGQLGTGGAENQTKPTLVDLPGPPVTKVSAGFNHSAALLEDGTLHVWGKFQGLEVKSEGGVVSVALYQDQLLPRPVSLAVPVLDVECAHFHTALLVQEDLEELGEQQGLGMLMFGMAASTRLQSPEPTPVPLPVAPTAQAHALKLLPACMSQTALHCPWTPSPYLRGYEGPNDDSQWVCEEGQGQVQGTVVGVSTGLAHKLLLVQEAP